MFLTLVAAILLLVKLMLYEDLLGWVQQQEIQFHGGRRKHFDHVYFNLLARSSWKRRCHCGNCRCVIAPKNLNGYKSISDLRYDPFFVAVAACPLEDIGRQIDNTRQRLQRGHQVWYHLVERLLCSFIPLGCRI
jgi:hypothetical protein